MKSIKEKAEEYSRCTASSEYTREDFVSGANYVLKEIEKELPLNDKCLNDHGKALVWRLKNCIEQLKK